MNWYPQLSSGAVTQFPLERTRRWRVIANAFEDGARTMVSDLAGGALRWRLRYEDLSATEVNSLTDLFAASCGRYGAFGFIDPTVNLLAGSEDLSRPDWQTGLLQVNGGVADPRGGTSAWVVRNPTPGSLEISQTLGVPGAYVTCFSVYLRSDTTGMVQIGRVGTSSVVAVGPAWRRARLACAGEAADVMSTFWIELAAGQTVEIWGAQVESQPAASAYKRSVVARGIYPNTRFEMDELAVVGTGPGLSGCEVRLVTNL